MTKKLLSLGLFVALSVTLVAGPVFAWSVASGDGTHYSMLQEKAIFFNNSGGTVASGQVVIIDRTGTGVTAGTTLGGYITTTTSADDALVVGVTSDINSCIDQSPCVVITKGPTLVECDDSSDAVTSGSAVGSATTAGRCGGGNGVGVALEAGLGADGNYIWVWVDAGGNN